MNLLFKVSVSDDSWYYGEVKVNNTEVYVSQDGVFVATKSALSYGETEIRVTLQSDSTW